MLAYQCAADFAPAERHRAGFIFYSQFRLAHYMNTAKNCRKNSD